MAAPRHSWFDSPSAGVSFPRKLPAMPSRACPLLPNEHRRSYHRHSGQSSVPVSPTLDRVHPATRSRAEATAGHLAESLLSGATPTRLPLILLVDNAGSTAALVCRSPALPPAT